MRTPSTWLTVVGVILSIGFQIALADGYFRSFAWLVPYLFGLAALALTLKIIAWLGQKTWLGILISLGCSGAVFFVVHHFEPRSTPVVPAATPASPITSVAQQQNATTLPSVGSNGVAMNGVVNSSVTINQQAQPAPIASPPGMAQTDDKSGEDDPLVDVDVVGTSLPQDWHGAPIYLDDFRIFDYPQEDTQLMLDVTFRDVRQRVAQRTSVESGLTVGDNWKDAQSAACDTAATQGSKDSWSRDIFSGPGVDPIKVTIAAKVSRQVIIAAFDQAQKQQPGNPVAKLGINVVVCADYTGGRGDDQHFKTGRAFRLESPYRNGSIPDVFRPGEPYTGLRLVPIPDGDLICPGNPRCVARTKAPKGKIG